MAGKYGLKKVVLCGSNDWKSVREDGCGDVELEKSK